MPGNYTGGCMCGAVRYDVPGEPLFANHCQCLDCQRRSGTGHGSYLTFPAEGVSRTGEAAGWAIVADDGNVKTHHFCADRGSPVFLTSSQKPEFFTIHVGSLDDPDRFEPQVITYAGRVRAWDPLDPALMRLPLPSPSAPCRPSG